jgi:hypothetical protein
VELDLAYTHALYVAQEAFDASEAVSDNEQLEAWVLAAEEAAALAIGAADNSFDYSVAAAASAAAAAASATAAATSAGAAATSEAAADASADAAAASAASISSIALLKANNLSDVTSRQTALNTLTAVAGASNEYVLTKDTGSGNAVWKSAALGGGGDMLAANNLSDLANAATARSNLSLGTMALENTGTYSTAAAIAAAYLTIANAASTYQTIAGMSSYLTTASASATYQPLSGMSSYLSVTTAQSDYVRKATAGTITALHTFEQGNGATAGASPFLQLKNTSGATDGKIWGWSANTSGSDDALRLGLYQDNGTYGNSIIEFVRTGASRKYVRFEGDLVAGGSTWDGSEALKIPTGNFTTYAKAVLFDSSASGSSVASAAYYQAEQNHSTMGTTETFDFQTFHAHKGTMDNNCTFTFTNAASVPFVANILLTQDATGSRVMTLPGTVKWPASYTAGMKLLSTAANSVDLLILRWTGSIYVANLIKGIA